MSLDVIKKCIVFIDGRLDVKFASKKSKKVGFKHRKRNDESSAASANVNLTLTTESCAFMGEFLDLQDVLSPRVIRSLTSCGYINTTAIQKSCIPAILQGCDVLIKSATGSGKTLTFMVPAINMLVVPSDGKKISRADGTRVLIICPTRELAMQSEAVASRLAKPFPWIVVSGIKGGDSRKSEKARLRKGVVILVGTPGRILDHCHTTSAFNCKNLQLFVLDEADRLLDLGFESKIKDVYKFIMESKGHTLDDINNKDTRLKHAVVPNIQTVLTSATLSSAVNNLAAFCLHRNLTTISDAQENVLTVPTTLEHQYISVSCKDRFMLLLAILLKSLGNGDKVLLFVANCPSVVYIHRLLNSLRWPSALDRRASHQDFKRSKFNADEIADDVEDEELLQDFKVDDKPTSAKQGGIFKAPIYMLHGSMEPNDRMGYMSDFIKHKCGLLISTDVACRGLNFEGVDLVIQYDPPQQLSEYIHRCGRCARLGSHGKAVLVLLEEQLPFLQELAKHKVQAKQLKTGTAWSWLENQMPRHLNKYKGDVIAFVRNSFCDDVKADVDLYSLASAAYKASIRSYKTYSKELRHCFDFRKLHLGHYATSFCINSLDDMNPKNKKTLVSKGATKLKRIPSEINVNVSKAIALLKQRDQVSSVKRRNISGKVVAKFQKSNR